MALIIRKRDNGEIFDIPSDFVLEANNQSPIFGELGSKTVSTSIPNTPHNRRLFENADRIDIKSKPKRKIPILIQDGAYQLSGMLYLLSGLNTTTEFEIVIAFDEGVMYEEMKNIKLSQLSNLPIIKKSWQEMITYMNYLHQNEALDEELTVFMIYLKTHEIEETKVPFYLNAGVGTGLELPSSVQVVSDSKLVTVSVPQGFGITPFVKVWAIIKYVFEHFGYTVGENPFISDFQLNRLCVLNNVADAIVTNTLDYSQLMPDVTIFEFFNALFCRFGTKLFVDNNTRTVNIKLLRDIFAEDKTYKDKIDAIYNITYSDPKQLKLSAARNLENSSTEVETYAEFLKKVQYTYDTTTKWIGYGAVGNGIFLDKTSGIFYKQRTGNIFSSKIMSSIHFNWDQLTSDVEYEEITSVDECLTMFIDYAIYYAVDFMLANSSLWIGTNVELDNTNKLAFAFDMGEDYVPLDNGAKEYLGYKKGSIFPYIYYGSTLYGNKVDKSGNEFKYALTFIGENGCFNHFFKEYDAFLRHSNNVIKFEWPKLEYESSKLDFSKPYLIAGNPILIEKATQNIGQNKPIATESRSLRYYEPYDLTVDQQLPEHQPILYKWVMANDRDSLIENKRTENELYYSKNPPSASASRGYQFISYTMVKIVEDDDIEDKEFWLLPPTKDQYQNKEKTGVTDYKCKVRFLLKYSYKELHANGSESTVQGSLPHDIEIDYTSFFLPQPV